jgi:ribosomal RNA assembly protein
METLYFTSIKELSKNKKELEEQLNVKINIDGKQVTIEGKTVDEFTALKVLDAMNFGFSAKKSLTLRNEEIMFKKIRIKNHTRRTLRDIKSRLIGTHGKTKKTMSEISGCEILIRESEVGFIGDVEVIEDMERAIINLIKGSKQANMYRYLERRNRERKLL